VPQETLGVATSSNTFLRSFGGAIGLAVLGSIVNVRFFSDFTSQIPESVSNTISMQELTALAHNPQALVSPAAQAQLKTTLSSSGLGSAGFEQVMSTLHRALSSAISEAFLIGFAILLVGLAATFFLNSKPAKK
jgi:hypothetical protein